jgi:hypothetical protein
MMPPELLHTSGSGLIMYMFELLHHQLGGGNNRHFINQEYIIISNIITRQSERDYPRGKMQNGLIDGTKCQSSEQKRESIPVNVHCPPNHCGESIEICFEPI